MADQNRGYRAEDANIESNLDGKHISSDGRNNKIHDRKVYKLTVPGMADKDDTMEWNEIVDDSEEDDVTYDDAYFDKLQRDLLGDQSEEQPTEAIMPSLMANTDSMASVQSLAEIPEAITPSRRSKRRASSADQDTGERAEKIKAARNLDVMKDKGNP